MTHCTYRSRVRAGHQTVTGPVTPTCSWDRWGRAETQRTALGEALIVLRRTRVRFPPPPPWVLPDNLRTSTGNSGSGGQVAQPRRARSHDRALRASARPWDRTRLGFPGCLRAQRVLPPSRARKPAGEVRTPAGSGATLDGGYLDTFRC